jgi:non-specific serine/threonine protein kinase
VALKFLPLGLTRDPEAKQRFIHEAQAASALEHPNICTVHEINETEDDRLFICMAYYKGETLKERIESHLPKVLNLREVLDIAIQVAEGLQAAHEKGIVHRDVKPANVMVTARGQVKIMDFGLAKLSGRTQVTQEGTTLGKISYMSPEQARAEQVDHRTDIWSFGVMLYEMVTGQLPFRGEYAQAVIYSIMNEEPEPVTALRSGVPMELERIVGKTLEKNKEDRYQHVDELLTDLRRLGKDLESAPVAVSRAAPEKPLWRKVTPVLAGGVAIVLLLLAAWLFQKEGAHEARGKSVAVLPFTAITQTEEDQIFSDGMHDDIITQLAKIRDLKVMARTSVVQYKNTQKRISDIGKELGVAAILEGSVRRAGDRIRIVAQLIDAESEEHLWAETYDRDYADVFAIQSDMAQQIALALQATLTTEERNLIESRPTENMKAYDYYLKGNYYWHNAFTDEGNKKAVEMYEKAIELDPNFAMAYARLAQASLSLYPGITPYLHSYNMDASDIEPPQEMYIQKAKSALDRAGELGPDLFETHLARGTYFNTTRHYDRAYKEYNLALAIQPNNSEIYGEIAWLFISQGKMERAMDYFKKKYESSQPGTIQAYWGSVMLAYIYKLLRKWQEAEKWSNIAMAINPEMPQAYGWKIETLLWGYGDLERARTTIADGDRNVTGPKQLIVVDMKYQTLLYSRAYRDAINILEKDPENRFNLVRKGMVYSLMMDNANAVATFDSARMLYEKLVEDAPEVAFYHSALGLSYAGLGRKNEAIRAGEKAVALKPVIKGGVNFYRTRLLLNLAHIYIMMGEYDRAINHLETLLSIPSQLTVWRLKLDPRYDPLRDRPEFQELLEKYSRGDV